MKGSNVFYGYLKDLEKIVEVLDKDGWLYTGDIGKWLLVSGRFFCLYIVLFYCWEEYILFVG